MQPIPFTSLACSMDARENVFLSHKLLAIPNNRTIGLKSVNNPPSSFFEGQGVIRKPWRDIFSSSCPPLLKYIHILTRNSHGKHFHLIWQHCTFLPWSPSGLCILLVLVGFLPLPVLSLPWREQGAGKKYYLPTPRSMLLALLDAWHSIFAIFPCRRCF